MVHRFRLGLALHSAFLAVIITLAYAGRLNIGALGHYDKVGHLVLIGMLAFFADGALARRPLVASMPWTSLAAFGVLVAAGLEELAQSLSPHRTCDVWDFAADVVGVVVLTAASRWISVQVEARGAAAA